MSAGSPERPRLRKREIAFAIAMGALAAGGAALFVADDGPSAPGDAIEAISGAREISYQAADFDEISTSGPQDVVVTRGDSFAVRSEGSPEALAQLEAVNINGRLTIRPKPGFNWGNWRSLAPATFYVTLPRLDAVAVAGSGDITIDRVEGESFEGQIAGSGSLAISAMKVDRANFFIGAAGGGSGDVVVSGTARDAHVTIAGSGEVKAGGLRSETASISIMGSGDVALDVEDEAKVSIAGSGDVDISGPARCSVTQMGSGDVRCAGGGGTD
jgi:hypothetical protein